MKRRDFIKVAGLGIGGMMLPIPIIGKEEKFYSEIQKANGIIYISLYDSPQSVNKEYLLIYTLDETERYLSSIHSTESISICKTIVPIRDISYWLDEDISLLYSKTSEKHIMSPVSDSYPYFYYKEQMGNINNYGFQITRELTDEEIQMLIAKWSKIEKSEHRNFKVVGVRKVQFNPFRILKEY